MCGTERLSAKPGTAVPRKLAFFWQQKKACKENCRCCECSGPRLRGCTPLRTPIRKSEGPMAKRTQYYCPFLTPSALPPLLNRKFPRTPAGGEVEAPLSKGAGRVSGLGDSDGLCAAAHSRATSAREKGPGCRPPSPLSPATHSRHPVGAGHARPLQGGVNELRARGAREGGSPAPFRVRRLPGNGRPRTARRNPPVR